MGTIHSEAMMPQPAPDTPAAHPAILVLSSGVESGQLGLNVGSVLTKHNLSVLAWAAVTEHGSLIVQTTSIPQF